MTRTVQGTVTLALAVVKTLAEVEQATQRPGAQATADATLWRFYLKGTSKTCRCEFNRDTGWAALGQAGDEPVRQVAIDADWSALRFR